MKKRIFTTLGYMSMFILGLIVVIGSSPVFIMITIYHSKDSFEDIIELIFINVLLISGLAILIYYIIKFFQWVDIDEKGITARNLVKKLHYKEWNEIREIREEWLPMSVRGGFVLKYFILIDEREDTITRNGIMRKNSYIMIPSNKKTEKIIKEFYQKDIIKLEADS